MIVQIKSSEIKKFIEINPKTVLLDVRTEEEWNTVGKPISDSLGIKTFFITIGQNPSFIDNLKMLYHVANIGDARSLAIHPATTTHSQLNEKELLAAGVTPGYVRLSIGIEHPDDIIADIKQALAA